MKVYEFGDQEKPVIMLFPGTCCYWKNNFGHVLDLLQQHFYTLVVSYSGFDETENTTFVSELDETEKIEAFIKERFDGKIFAAYGCSLGGSVVSLLVSRQNVHIDHAMIGSSDMDQAPKWLAKLETALMIPVFYPLITGNGSSRLRKKLEKKMNEESDRSEYIKKFENDGDKQWDGFFLYFQGIDEKSVLHGSLYESRHQDRGAGNRHSCILRKENGREIFETVFQVFCESGHPGI